MRQADWVPKSEPSLVERGLLNPCPPARPPVRPSPPQSARPPSPPDRGSSAPNCPVRPSACLPVRAFTAVRVSAPRGPRPLVRSIVRTLSAPIRLTVRALSALSARPLVRPFARPPCQCPSAHPPVGSVHASFATSARPVRHDRSAHVRQPPLYISHPASPQIIQLLVVRVAPLRTAALRGPQGLREVGVNCGGNPCNLFFAQQAAWRGKAFTSRETGLQQ